MALVNLNLKPSDAQLREFGEITLCMCNVIGVLLWWLGKLPASGLVIFCLAGVAVYLLSRISVKLIKPIYLGLIVATYPIGWVVSHLLMGLFYYGVITPVGLLFKVIGRDPLRRRYDRSAASYWTAYREKRSAKDYFRQF